MQETISPLAPLHIAPLHLKDVATLSGANWVAPRSVLVASVGGTWHPMHWPAVRSLLVQLLPAGLPDGPFPPPPDHAAAAVETLGGLILGWFTHPPPAVERTAAGRQASHLAAIPLGNADMTITAMRIAVMVLDQAAISDAPADAWIDRMRRNLLGARHAAAGWLPLSRRRIARAAEARSIPWRPLHAAPNTLQLGEGRHARRFDASHSWRTSVLAATLAGDKRRGNQMLRRRGVPVARQRIVTSADEVRAAVPNLGLPLVLKPTGLRLALGMRIVYREADIDEAWAVSSGFDQTVVAESYIPGNEYRVLVLDGEVIAALVRVPATVTGDGRSTIAELVERENRNPRRGDEDEGFPLEPIQIDALAERYLEHEGRSYRDVPGPGQVVQVHPLPMIRYGGGGRLDVTDRIHPDNREMAARAVNTFGLDIAGIDLRMPDITRSWREVGAGICEVNPQPNLNLHYDIGSPIDVAGRWLDHCYPPADRKLMRHILLLGDGDLDGHLSAIARALRGRFGWRIATVSRNGIDLNGWRPEIPARTLPSAYGAVVEDSSLDAAAYAVPVTAAMATGLGMQHVDVALAAPGVAGRARELAIATLRGIGQTLEPMPETPDAAAAAVLAALTRS